MNENAIDQFLNEEVLFDYLDGECDNVMIPTYNNIYDYFMKIIKFIQKRIAPSSNIKFTINRLIELVEIFSNISIEPKKFEFESGRKCCIWTSIYANKNDTIDQLLIDLWYRNSEPFFGTYGFGIECVFDGLSTGEEKIIKVMSSIKRMPVGSKYLLLLDEPDVSLHPEWERLFIDILVKLLNQYDCKVDVIMTTHSPLPISDFIKDSVHILGNKLEIETFCGNIGELMISNFFLKRPFGEFSYLKVKDITDKLDNQNYVFKKEELLEIEFLISNIGDIVLKKSLYFKYNNWLENHPENIELQIKKINEEIAFLNKKLVCLEEMKNDKN